MRRFANFVRKPVIVLVAVSSVLAGNAWGASQQMGAPRLLLPHQWVRGYFDFELAPPHHEIDLGVCAVPGSACSAYARYQWSAYIEVHPFGRGPLEHAFVFVNPIAYGGDTLPQVRYSASPAPILWERTSGVGLELPKGFQLRLTQHQNYMLGRFAEPGAMPMNPNGPYGLNMKIGVRWNFGGWDNSSGPVR